MARTKIKNSDVKAEGAQATFESVGNRLIGMMRLILAVSALLIIYIDPSEPDRLVAVTYCALILYALYSGILYWLTARHSLSLFTKSFHWIDIGWYLLFVALSSGTTSIFFFFFFFAILVASFRWGYAQGLQVTIVSAVLFTVIVFATALTGSEFELNRFLLRPVYLLVLGYMMAYWGGFEVTLMRRLALLKEVNKLSNPRFGVDQTVGIIIERLRAFYEADACLLISSTADASGYLMWRADRVGAPQTHYAERLPPQVADSLLALPPGCAIAYRDEPDRWWQLRRHEAKFCAYEFGQGATARDVSDACAELAGLLGAKAFVTVPLHRRDEVIGRLYLTTNQRRQFDLSDIDFLRQLLEQVMPVIENIQLLDRLASEAAARERQKISRDIHDSTIQPYIGIKLGLDALRHKATPDNPLTDHIKELIAIADDGIADLRRYIGGLKGTTSGSRAREAVLLPAVRRQAEKFSDLYGIEVVINAAEDVAVNDRLAAEAFQIVNEGLSNIRRHTQARRAVINLAA